LALDLGAKHLQSVCTSILSKVDIENTAMTFNKLFKLYSISIP
jgi:hypothetical protein